MAYNGPPGRSSRDIEEMRALEDRITRGLGQPGPVRLGVPGAPPQQPLNLFQLLSQMRQQPQMPDSSMPGFDDGYNSGFLGLLIRALQKKRPPEPPPLQGQSNYGSARPSMGLYGDPEVMQDLINSAGNDSLRRR